MKEFNISYAGALMMRTSAKLIVASDKDDSSLVSGVLNNAKQKSNESTASLSVVCFRKSKSTTEDILCVIETEAEYKEMCVVNKDSGSAFKPSAYIVKDLEAKIANLTRKTESPKSVNTSPASKNPFADMSESGNDNSDKSPSTVPGNPFALMMAESKEDSDISTNSAVVNRNPFDDMVEPSVYKPLDDSAAGNPFTAMMVESNDKSNASTKEKSPSGFLQSLFCCTKNSKPETVSETSEKLLSVTRVSVTSKSNGKL